ncbi:MAG: Fibronectin type domain protein, partial [Nocardioides sp.]|nr:Fibronectin type domain protein [Nocardioides sp.]
LDRPTRGAAALRAIGDDLGRAAAVNGVSGARLRHILRTDDTAYVSSSGRLFYRDVRTTPERPTVVGRAPFPDSETFTLHSLPGAQRTIHLDFDGANVSGTFWNAAEGGGLANRTVSAFDTDGAPGTFSAGEKATIQQVWQRVAEDYAPFQVDVTTEAPAAGRIDRTGAADLEYGTAVVVSSDEDAHQRLCGDESCTGIALIDVFDFAGTGPGDNHAFYQPAWAFTRYYNSVKSIADTVSHEVGHNLGLNHWGDDESAYYPGHGSWFPMMGSSLNPIGQWSKGEYPGAIAEQTDVQDDLALITARGAPYRADDAGPTVATASTLPTDLRVISTPDDVDVYALGSCSGPVSVTGATAYADPNLDLKLSLLDATGTAVATADPASGTQSAGVASGMGATVSTTATGAPLFVAVDGVGSKTFASLGYNDYGSLGAYELERTGTCGAQAGVPSAPLSVTATPTGDTSVSVTWSAPTSAGSSPLTGYTVSSPGAATVPVPAGTTTYPAAGLLPGTTYTFTVAAVNAAGPGPGATATATTSGVAAGPTAPGVVTGLAAAWDVAAQEALVTWRPPAVDGGSAVEGYDVYVDDDFAGSLAADTDGVIASAADFGFTPGSVHTVEVCAFNEIGCGTLASASFVAKARPATVPAAPRIGRATPGAAGGTRTAIVAWAPTSTGGSTITSYLVLAYKYSGSRVVATRTFKAGASVRRGQVPVGAGVWRFRVRALNAVGRSRPSGLSNAVTAR